MKFPVKSLLAGNLRTSETGSLETASSSGESSANLTSDLPSPDGQRHGTVAQVSGSRAGVRVGACCDKTMFWTGMVPL